LEIKTANQDTDLHAGIQPWDPYHVGAAKFKVPIGKGTLNMDTSTMDPVPGPNEAPPEMTAALVTQPQYLPTGAQEAGAD